MFSREGESTICSLRIEVEEDLTWRCWYQLIIAS